MVLRPQIITNLNVLTSLIAPSGARNAAMLGSATWGPIDTVTTISSMSEFINTFGDDVTGSTGANMTLVKGADLFFANGGTLKVVRLDDTTAAKSDYMALNGVTDVINFEATYKGTYGNNITITITTIGSNRGIQITDGKVLEVFTNGNVGYSTNAAIETVVNANSSLVTAAVETGKETTDLADALTATYLTGGLDGATLTNTIYSTAMDDLLLTESYNFLLIPGWTTDGDHSTWVGKLNARASAEKLYSRFITGVAKDETIATSTVRAASGKRITVMSPNVKYTHRIDDTAMILDGSYLACAYAGKLCATDLEVSGTHETVSVSGLSVLESTGKEYWSKAEQESLLEGRIMPVSLIGGAVQCVRGITRNTSTTEVWFEEVIVDIIDYVTTQCENYLNTVLGKPNTIDARKIYAARLDAILQTVKDEGIIQSFNESAVLEASSPDTINATISIKPAYNTNFVNLTINVQ